MSTTQSLPGWQEKPTASWSMCRAPGSEHYAVIPISNGANALIPERKVIPDRSLVVGSPGRVVRTLSDEEVAALRQNAQHYIDAARRYRRFLRRID